MWHDSDHFKFFFIDYTTLQYILKFVGLVDHRIGNSSTDTNVLMVHIGRYEEKILWNRVSSFSIGLKSCRVRISLAICTSRVSIVISRAIFYQRRLIYEFCYSGLPSHWHSNRCPDDCSLRQMQTSCSATSCARAPCPDVPSDYKCDFYVILSIVYFGVCEEFYFVQPEKVCS